MNNLQGVTLGEKVYGVALIGKFDRQEEKPYEKKTQVIELEVSDTKTSFFASEEKENVTLFFQPVDASILPPDTMVGRKDEHLRKWYIIQIYGLYKNRVDAGNYLTEKLSIEKRYRNLKVLEGAHSLIKTTPSISTAEPHRRIKLELIINKKT